MDGFRGDFHRVSRNPENTRATAHMQFRVSAQELERIVVGQPIPFSVFSADGKLLLAAGRIVETENIRQKLVTQATNGEGDRSSKTVSRDDSEPTMARVILSPLAKLRQSYKATNTAPRLALTMARDETSEAFRTSVIGVRDTFIVADVPIRPNGSLVAISAGQTWLFRTFQLTSAFKFFSTVLKVASEPFPHLHIATPVNLERRKVRGRNRVTVLLDATLRSASPTPCVLVDLSVGGGRIATQDGVILELQQPVQIAMQLDLLENKFDLLLNAVVVGASGASEGEHPHVLFYGVRFESLTQLESLVLHGFVNSHQALELNCLWHVLSAASSD
jgi:hypothetical protein